MTHKKRIENLEHESFGGQSSVKFISDSNPQHIKPILEYTEQDMLRFAQEYKEERRKQPAKCPVCKGRCEVPELFYGPYGIEVRSGHDSNTVTSNSPKQCRSCEGKGYVVI